LMLPFGINELPHFQGGRSDQGKPNIHEEELRTEIGSVRTELGLMQQQLVTLNGSLFHQRSEFTRLEDRIARLEVHVGIEDSPQH